MSENFDVWEMEISTGRSIILDYGLSWWFKLKSPNNELVSYKHAAFEKILIDGLLWCFYQLFFPRVVQFSGNVHFWVNHSFKYMAL